MKRERKHRVWNGLEMVYDVMVGKFGVFYVNPGKDGKGLDERDSASLTPFNTIFSEGTPVMDFTGLHDKNGKEIYEGDIVNMVYDEPYNRPHIVIWHLNKFIAIHLSQYKKGNDFVDGKLPNSYNAKVIGNIYENPELLK